MSDYDDLRAKALAALTVGEPWAATADEDGGVVRAKRGNHAWTIAETDYGPHAAYIAAVSPDVVLGLLDRLMAAEAHVAASQGDGSVEVDSGSTGGANGAEIGSIAHNPVGEPVGVMCVDVHDWVLLHRRMMDQHSTRWCRRCNLTEEIA